jgi:hypothetical protein
MAANLPVLIGEKGAGGIVAAGDSTPFVLVPKLCLGTRGVLGVFRSAFMGSCIEHVVEKPALRLACCCLSFGLLVLLGGCGSNNPRSAEHTKVSGQVLFQGQPLPGGRVTFVAVNGGFASSEKIDKNGNYQIPAPVGEVEIGVTNRMLKPRTGKAPLRPQKAGAKEDQPLEGRWVSIPPHYEDPHTSGLRYMVKSGPQTHNIELSASSSPAPGASGP